MNQPPPNQQFQQQIPAGHINFIYGTNNIFSQQLPQQQPPAGSINMMEKQLLRIREYREIYIHSYFSYFPLFMKIQNPLWSSIFRGPVAEIECEAIIESKPQRGALNNKSRFHVLMNKWWTLHSGSRDIESQRGCALKNKPKFPRIASWNLIRDGHTVYFGLIRGVTDPPPT
ncbi:13283_t:CDS:2 [Ambispora leptoticha]|uniref:13283_t:CDS:1 n=1 Tax=Ambispora leptoticha TaxID=144679 RepID=A0A9N9AAI3_9GLOM|nr:13283_t:CDS:2 [Ambispora leptoticha]